jgi:hypothetical protein
MAYTESIVRGEHDTSDVAFMSNMDHDELTVSW